MAAMFDAILRINARATGESDVRRLTSAISGLGGAASGIGALTTALTGVGAALGGIGVAAGAKGIIDMADSLDELSQRSGVTVETLSKLGLAARQSGLDTEQVSGALVKLSRNLGNIATGGGKDAAAALSALGISATDSSGQLKNADQILMEVADRFQQMPDGAMKAKLAMDLFGKSGAAMVPLLNQGSDAIEGLNTGISANFAKSAGTFNDQMETIIAQATAFGAVILEQALPYLIKAADAAIGFGSALFQALDRNREPIKAMIGSFVETAKILLPIAANIAKVYIGFQALRGAILAATLVTKAFALVSALTPQGLLMLGAAAVIGFKAYEQIEAKMKQITAEAQQGNQATATGTNLTQQMADAAEAAAAAYAQGNTERDRGKELAKEIAANERLLGEQIKQSNAAYDAGIDRINLRTNALERANDVAAQENNLQVATNSLGQAILQNKLSLAKTDQEKLAITRRIAELEQEAADLQYQATLQQIELERQLLIVKRDAAEAERQKAQAAYFTAYEMYKQGKIPWGKVVPLGMESANTTTAAEARNAELQQFGQSANIRQQLADVNRQTAMVRTNGQVQQAEAAMQRLQGNVNSGVNQWGNTFFVNVPQFARGGYVTGRTLAEIGEGGPEYVVPASKAMAFANNIVAGRRGEQALIPIGNAAKQAAGYIFDPFGVERTRRDIAARKGNIMAFEKLRIDRENRRIARIDPWVKPISGSSSMGRGSVTFGRAANPLGAMPAAAPAPAGPIQISVQTGPVMELNGQKFVSYDDLERAMRATADGVIGRLRTPSARLALGSR